MKALYKGIAAALFAVAVQTRAMDIGEFGRTGVWKHHDDGGVAPALAPAPDGEGLLVRYTNRAPGWGNIIRSTRFNGTETALALSIRLVEAADAAAMHLWLLENDRDMWVAPLTDDGRPVGKLPPGPYTFTVPLDGFTFQPRGNRTPDVFATEAVLIGFNFGDQTVVLRSMNVVYDEAARQQQLAAQREKQAMLEETLTRAGYSADAPYHIAVFKDPDAPTPTAASDPDRLADLLGTEGANVARIGPALLADPNLLTPDRFDLLLLPYGPSFPADAEESIRAFCAAGGDFISVGGYAFDAPYGADDDESANLLKYPGFEQPQAAESWGADAATTQGDTPGAVTRGLSSDRPHSGTRCFRIHVPAGVPKRWYNLSQACSDVTPGKGYLATAWLRTDSVSDGFAYLAVSFHRQDGSRISFVHGNAPVRGEGTTDWTRQKVAFTVPAGTAYALVVGNLYGFGTAFFDDVELRLQHRVTLNTRHGQPRDALSLRPDQIGVFDPSYRLERAVSAVTSADQHIVSAGIDAQVSLEGYAAVGMTSHSGAVSPEPRARWTSLIQARDGYGRMVGSVAGITHNFTGTFRHSLWAYLGVENTDLFDGSRPLFDTALRQIGAHIRNGLFLHSPETTFALYESGEEAGVRVHVANSGREARQVTVVLHVLESDRTVLERSRDLSVPAGEGLEVAFSFVCPPAPSGLVACRFTLHCAATVRDTVRTGFVVPLATDTDGFPLAYRDNMFRAGDRPMVLFGTNQTGVTFGPHYENALTWAEDFGRCRDYGLNVWRLLHISPYADAEWRSRGYQKLDEPPEWLIRRMDAVFLLAQRYRIIPFPCWHDWTGGASVSDEALRQQRAFVKVYGERYGRLSAMLYDVSNEAPVRPNPIPDLNREFAAVLRDTYGSVESLRGAWQNPDISFESVRFEKPPEDWSSRRARDIERFRLRVADRWLAANVTALRETGDRHPVTDEYYLLPAGDAFDARQYITFANVHHYGNWEPGFPRFYDRRMQGRSFAVGEFGRRHHPSMDNGGWGYLPEPEVRDFFRRVAFLTVACGASTVSNWDWKDMRGCVFPWGLNYPNELVPKKVARDWRNLALFLRQFPLVHTPETVWFVIPDEFLIGGRQKHLQGRVISAMTALSVTGIPFSVIRQYELAEALARHPAPKLILRPLPYIMTDREVHDLRAYAADGGTVYLSGDCSFTPEREPGRAAVLESLAGLTLHSRRYPAIDVEAADTMSLSGTVPGAFPVYAPRPALAGTLSGAARALVRTADEHVPLLVEHTVGSGRILFLNDPAELHAEQDVLRRIYAFVARSAGADRLPLTPDSPEILAYRLRTTDGAELTVALNEGDAPETVRFGTLELHCSGGSQTAALITPGGAVTALALDGAVQIEGRPFATGEGRALVFALDDRDLRESLAVLVLPLGTGLLRLQRSAPHLTQLVGEFVDGRWKSYERIDNANDLHFTELRSTAFALICEPAAAQQWIQNLEARLNTPENPVQ